jgi:transcriptional regulator with XRE-family HTH domain
LTSHKNNIVANQFGSKIKELREANGLLQRQVASQMEIDTPMLSKIERGERKARKEQVVQFAKLYKADRDELLTLWLADQLYDVIQGEAQADEALKNVTSKLKKEK